LSGQRVGEKGDVGVLRTQTAAFEVRIANVVKELPDIRDRDGTIQYRLGLQRLRDLPVAISEPGKPGWLSCLFPNRMQGPGVSSAALIAVAVSLSGILVAAAAWTLNHGRAMATRVASTSSPSGILSEKDGPGIPGKLVIKQVAAESKGRSASSSEGTANSGQTSGGSARVRETAAAVQQAVSDTVVAVRDSVRESVRRLSGPSALLVPDVGRLLELTDLQKEQIRALSDTASEALERLEAKSRSDSRFEHSQRRAALLDEAQRQALDVLTPEQRERWEALQ
jgi:hypothetical protein